MRENKNAYALFIDILGFAELVEVDGSVDALTWEIDDPPATGTAKLVADRFNAFHSVLQYQLEQSSTKHVRTSLIFSDSAFIVTSVETDIFDLAVHLMRRLLRAGVPTRMGVGRGSFVAMRFFTDSYKHADKHGCQFLGQSIVRSVRAEGCGLPGCRILLHPTTPLPPDYAKYRALSVPIVGNKCGVQHELNYIHLDSEEMDPIIDPELMSAELHDVDLVGCVDDLKSIAPADKHYQYDETLSAINRMRTAYGRDALPFDARTRWDVAWPRFRRPHV